MNKLQIQLKKKEKERKEGGSRAATNTAQKFSQTLKQVCERAQNNRCDSVPTIRPRGHRCRCRPDCCS